MYTALHVLYNFLIAYNTTSKNTTCTCSHTNSLLPLTVSNVLVRMDCSCQNALECQCHPSAKPCIQLADFDSVKKVSTLSPRAYQMYHEFPVTQRTREMCGRVLGTPGYRAPEVQQCNDVYTHYCISQLVSSDCFLVSKLHVHV